MRKSILWVLVAVAAPLLSMALAGVAGAQTFPQHALRLVAPFPAGTTTDQFARLLAAGLSEHLGQTVIVENRDGAAGAIGANNVARSAPDGYTLLVAATPLVLTGLLSKKPPYDAFTDFAPVSLIGQVPSVLLVSTASPAHSLEEFIRAAKAHPKEFTYASAGLGTSSQLGMELLNSLAGIQTTDIPYKAAGQGITDMLGGQVSANMPHIDVALPLIRSGLVRALGVTSVKRLSQLPDVPAIGEVVPGYSALGWFALMAPARTPPDVIEKLNGAVRAVLESQSIKQKMEAQGTEVASSTPAELNRFLHSERERWEQLFHQLGVQPE